MGATSASGLPTRSAFRGAIDFTHASTWAAADVLQHPEEWPLEILGKAIQAESAKVSRLPSIARVTAEDRWFQAGG